MEKFGVELDENKVKEAGQGAKKPGCPKCGAALDVNGFCPNHGSEPFEKKPAPPERGEDGS